MSEIIISYQNQTFDAEPIAVTETQQPAQPSETNIREASITDPVMIGVLAGGVALIGFFTWIDNNGRRNQREYLARLESEKQTQAPEAR